MKLDGKNIASLVIASALAAVTMSVVSDVYTEITDRIWYFRNRKKNKKSHL